jgi:hypothetical protein
MLICITDMSTQTNNLRIPSEIAHSSVTAKKASSNRKRPDKIKQHLPRQLLQTLATTTTTAALAFGNVSCANSEQISKPADIRGQQNTQLVQASKTDKTRSAQINLARADTRKEVKLPDATITIDYHDKEYANVPEKNIYLLALKKHFENHPQLKNIKLDIPLKGTNEKCDAATATSQILEAAIDTNGKDGKDGRWIPNKNQNPLKPALTVFKDRSGKRQPFCNETGEQPEHFLNKFTVNQSLSGNHFLNFTISHKDKQYQGEVNFMAPKVEIHFKGMNEKFVGNIQFNEKNKPPEKEI